MSKNDIMNMIKETSLEIKFNEMKKSYEVEKLKAEIYLECKNKKYDEEYKTKQMLRVYLLANECNNLGNEMLIHGASKLYNKCITLEIEILSLMENYK